MTARYRRRKTIQCAQSPLRRVLCRARVGAGVAVWELVVRINDIPPYVLPGPVAVICRR